MESRIAILGSCITRDLWPVRGGGSERLLYISRTSFPSLFSPPVAGFEPAEETPGDLTAHEHRALIADLRKTALASLVAFRPTHLIFDFIDERFDLLSAGRALASRSSELLRSGYAAQPAFEGARVIPRLSAVADRLWAEGLAQFAALVRSTPLVHARPILHRARWASRLRRPDGTDEPIRDVQIISGHPADISPYNDLLERQDAAFLAAMSGVEVVEAMEPPLADPDHRWGLSPFHYTADYYEAVRTRLASIPGLEDAFRAAPAAPSVPGA
ncbi:DUF6270 domain-containing protein [Phenylobacterium sp.]|uniref:DUF6270 domain-containing protein n=1 Tax=Phenylobacterium sp. TaxID=1871053 RepID=UPI00301D5F14